MHNLYLTKRNKLASANVTEHKGHKEMGDHRESGILNIDQSQVSYRFNFKLRCMEARR